MISFFRHLLDTDDFPARWTCGRWSDAHGWVHISSDGAIFGAYAAIPVALIYFIRQRRDMPFPPLIWLFAAFIFACGFGHLIEATLFWHPWYRLSGLVKAFTAVVSWMTVVALVRLLPQALALPGLAEVNRRLEAEIAERKRLEEHFRLVIEASPSAMLMVDERGVMKLVNNQAEQLFGYSRTDLLGQPVEMLVPARYRAAHPGHREGFFRSPSTRAMGSGRDLFGLRKDGREVPIEIGLKPIRTDEGAFVLASIINITERKRHEDSINASLAEKEILLKEVHHRVKNNMQVISSILNLQAGYIEDARAKSMFEDCQDRVRSMAMIHEKLYRSQNLATIDFGQHVRELAEMLVCSVGSNASRVRLETEADPVPLEIDTAIPVGLILNELVSNALKHAFPAGRGGKVRVRLRRDEPGMLLLSVGDDGVGLPESFQLEQARSLGLKMIRSLTRQLNGRLELKRERGAEFLVTFPAPLANAQEAKAP